MNTQKDWTHYFFSYQNQKYKDLSYFLPKNNTITMILPKNYKKKDLLTYIQIYKRMNTHGL